MAGALNTLGDLAQLRGDTHRATALYEQSLVLWRELRGAPGIASALHKLGQVRRFARDIPGARALLLESLELQRDLGNKQGIGECLVGLAATVAVSGDTDRAAKIFAAGSALLQAIGVPLAPLDRLALSNDLRAAREECGADLWDVAWDAGSTMSPEDAIALALKDDTVMIANGEHQPPAAAPSPSSSSQYNMTGLSPREHEVSRLVAEGLTNREIARALSITEKTVGSHIDHIMTKLGLRSRTRIAVWVIEQGGGRPGPTAG